MKKQASKKKLVEHTVTRLEEAQARLDKEQAETLSAIGRSHTNNRIADSNEKIIHYLDTAANYALDSARHILPKVADVKAHPLPAFQDLTTTPVSKRTLKDVTDEIADYLNDELQFAAPGMMRGLEDFLTWYQGKFLEALHRLTEKKIAVCDTLGKPAAKQKLIEAFSVLPSFPSPEAFEDYNRRILAGDDPNPTEEMVSAWRKHQPVPFPDPDKFADAFRCALMLDAEATDEINGNAATAAPCGYTESDRKRDERTAEDARKAAAGKKRDFENKSKGGKKGARTRKDRTPPDSVHISLERWIKSKMKEWDDICPERKKRGYKGHYSNAQIFRDAERSPNNRNANNEPIFTAEQIKEWFKPSKIKRRGGRVK